MTLQMSVAQSTRLQTLLSIKTKNLLWFFLPVILDMYPPALQEKNEKNCEAFQKTGHLLEQILCFETLPTKEKLHWVMSPLITLKKLVQGFTMCIYLKIKMYSYFSAISWIYFAGNDADVLHIQSLVVCLKDMFTVQEALPQLPPALSVSLSYTTILKVMTTMWKNGIPKENGKSSKMD